jgi:cytochrome c peroxidase
VAALAGAAVFALRQPVEQAAEQAEAPGLGARAAADLLPLPPVPALPPAKVALGRSLFHDVRLSKDNSIACASCHDLATAGHDGRRFSVGVGGAVGSVNAPTVFNAALNVAQFWDGRAATLEEQAPGPVHNPLEMATDWPTVLARLNADVALVAEFRQVYGDGPSAERIVDAIATFERTLLTPDAPFDRYLRGDVDALDMRAKAGLRLFREVGCASCHQGANIGGNMFQRFGVMMPPPADKAGQPGNLGRFNVTGREEDRYVFKVPSLRNVALTAPYFHDGSAATLEEAVATMGRSQLGRELSPAEIDLLAAFLRSLSGAPPASVQP